MVSIHVGVNEAPAGSGLAPLRYADDDAARFFQLFSQHAAASFALTTLDRTSSLRHRDLAQAARPARRADLREALARARAIIDAAHDQGHKTQLVFTYSGHGLVSGSATSLALLDGTIDRAFVESELLTIRADTTHLVVDACHGAGLVGGRGLVQQEGTARTLRGTERTAALGDDMLARHPHVGALFAASPDQETHEWSDVEGGVFSHEVLSALAGAADINIDGVVGYGEVAAFVGAANRDIPDPRASLDVIALPPRINPQAPLVDHAWLRDVAFLEDPMQALGHFRVEREDGLRVVDAHFGPHQPMRIAIPANTQLWIRTQQTEATFHARAGARVPVAQLVFSPSRAPQARGAVENALKRGLFSAPLTQGYYEGFVDSRGLPRVASATTVVSLSQAPRPTDGALAADPLNDPGQNGLEPKPGALGGAAPYIAATTGAGAIAAGLVAVGFATLGAVALVEYNSTSEQRASAEALSRLIGFGTVAGLATVATVGCGGFSVALLLAE